MSNRSAVEEIDKVFNNVNDIYNETDIITLTFEEPDLAGQVREKIEPSIMAIITRVWRELDQCRM